jgi:hypothetical protein
MIGTRRDTCHSYRKGKVMDKLVSRTGRKAARAVRSMTIPARRMAAILSFVALLSGAAVAWSAAPASAALTVTLHFKDGSKYSYDCSVGKTWSVNATVTQVQNSCNTQVWLHEHADNKGTNWCTPAVASSDPPIEVYANLYISSSDANC